MDIVCVLVLVDQHVTDLAQQSAPAVFGMQEKPVHDALKMSEIGAVVGEEGGLKCALSAGDALREGMGARRTVVRWDRPALR